MWNCSVGGIYLIFFQTLWIFGSFRIMAEDYLHRARATQDGDGAPTLGGFGWFFFFGRSKGNLKHTPLEEPENTPLEFRKSSSKWDDFQVLMPIFRGVNDCDHPFWSLSGDKFGICLKVWLMEKNEHPLGPEIEVNGRDFQGPWCYLKRNPSIP